MLCKVNGTAPEDYGKAIPEQTHAPDFDLVAKLKARLRWLGHVLRMPETSLLRRVVLRHGTTDLPEGTIFDDAPAAGSRQPAAGSRHHRPGLPRVFPEKRLELKSLKAEDLGARCLELSLKAL
jgi:hypothetical protein